MRIGTFKRRVVVEPLRLPVRRREDERAPSRQVPRRPPKRVTTAP
jgi:hypothetical protein